jgi:hypothetical protein
MLWGFDLLILAGVLELGMTLVITYKVSRHADVPQLIDSHREMFERCVKDIKDLKKADDCSRCLTK